MNHLIYSLCEVHGAPFYVGRTKRTLEVRLGEHRRTAKSGTEAKYQHIRKLISDGKGYEIVLLQEVGPDTENFEDFWVYTLIIDGYDLTNMRAGDAKSAAERDAMLEMKKRGERFTDPKTFLDAREREIAESKARKAAQKLIEKTRKESNTSSDLTRWAGDFGKPLPTHGLQEIMNRRKR